MSICVTLDIEGVLLPELWTALADHTGEDAFRRTTTEEGDIAVLMHDRLAAARAMGLTRSWITAALTDVMPFAGAVEFLQAIRGRWPTILVSDTFNEMISVVSHKLIWPTIFCHSLQFDNEGILVGYRLRQHDQKPKVVTALRSAGFRIMAAGDSLNDIGMLRSADAGAFINAPAAIRRSHPDLPGFETYGTLFAFFEEAAERLEVLESSSIGRLGVFQC
jgi:phosphoserine / homoserine phosphotransferase